MSPAVDARERSHGPPAEPIGNAGAKKTEWPLWEVFVRSKAASTTSIAAACTRPTRRWRSSSPATSTRGARKAPASGWCAPTRSSPPTRATRRRYFDPMADKVYRHPTFYELPKSLDHM